MTSWQQERSQPSIAMEQSVVNKTADDPNQSILKSIASIFTKDKKDNTT